MLNLTSPSSHDTYILSGDYYGFIWQQANLQRSLDAEARRAHCETLDSWLPDVQQPQSHEERLANIASIYEQFLLRRGS